MHWSLLLVFLMTIPGNAGGFYIIEPSVLSSDRKFYQISSNDLLSLTRCEKKIKFNNNEDIFITYMKRSHEANFMPILDVFLELSTLESSNVQQTLNISGKTSNMTHFTLHGNSISIRLDTNDCKHRMMRIATDCTIFISITKPSDRCPDPGTPDNSLRTGETDEFVIGSNFRFSCHHEYLLSGSEVISCVRDPYTGMLAWTGSSPLCVRKCEKPPAPRFGRVFGVTSNGSAHFMCQKPFVLVGPKMITCLQNGAKSTWNDFPPKCIITTCPANGSVLTATYQSKMIATPGFPGNRIYSNMTCKWDIQSRNNACIHIYFDTFDIPNKGVVFEIHKYVGSFSGDSGDLVWSSRPGEGEPRRRIIVCGRLLRVSYTSGEMAATGHGGVLMWYLARPISEYHAAYQRAVHIAFNDQITPDPTKATDQTQSDDGSGVDVPAIAAGVTVPVVLLIIAGVAIYIWYRKKYPVRMIIGKDFGKFSNPVYNKRNSTATLTRPDSFEKEIQKMSAETCVSHDNHVDLSDEHEYQPTAGLTLLGSLGFREGLDVLDSPEMRKRNSTKQRKKIRPGSKIVIEEDEEGEKDEVTNISDSSSNISSTSEEKDSASDENSDGEGFRPVTDAPKIKRKRVSAYLNEVLDRQNSQDSAYGDKPDGSGVIPDTESASGSVDVVVHAAKQQQTEEEMPNKDELSNNEDVTEVEVSTDVPSTGDTMEQNVMNETTQGVSRPDRPMAMLKPGIQDINFTNKDDDEGSQSSTGTDKDTRAEEAMRFVQNDPTLENVNEINLTPEEIMTEVNNLLQQEEAQPSTDSTVQHEQTNDTGQLEHDRVPPTATEEHFVEGEGGTLTSTEESDAASGDKLSDEKESLINGIPDVSETNLTDPVNNTGVSSKDDVATVVNPAPSLLDDIQLEWANRSNGNNRDVELSKMTDTRTDSAVESVTTEMAPEMPEGLGHNTQDITGYLTRDEMRELTARTKSFGEDSISSVYSGEMVEEVTPVVEIAEQDYFSSGLSLDETDSVEIPYINKVEVQFERLIQDIDKHANSSDSEEEDDVTEKAEQEENTAKTKTEESMTSFDPASFGGISNEWNGETSDFLPLVDHSESNDTQTLATRPSLSEDFANVAVSLSHQPMFDFSSFENTNRSTDNSSNQPVTLVMHGFDTGESSTDVQNQVNGQKSVPNGQLFNESSGEDDSDDSKESNEDLMEYIINPDINGDDIEDEEGDDQVDELQLTAESGGMGRRKSITLDNPSFDSLDFSKFQKSTLDAKLEDSDEEPDTEVQMKPSTLGRRRESVSLDNPFFDTDEQVLPEPPPHQGEKLRVIQVSNLLVTPPTSSNESSSEDSDSETGSGGEYQVNPSSDREEAEDKMASIKTQLQVPDLPVGVANFLSLDSQNEPSLASPLDYDPRTRTKLEPIESDVSSLDSATVKEIEDMSSDSEASNKDHEVAAATASAPAPKKFSLASISRKFKSSFKTTAKPDLQTGDKDMVDV